MSIDCAITVCLVPEAKLGPFVLHGELETCCEQAAQLGFRAIELFPPSADELDGYQLRAILQKHHLRLAAVGTGAGWVRRKLRLTDPDPHVRMCARDFAAALVDFAGGFGVPAILGSMQGRWGDGVSREEAVSWFTESLEQLGPRAHALDTPLLFEPLNRYETNLFNTVDETLGFLTSLRTQNVKLLCDLFHMNIEEADLPAALGRVGKKLGHVHWADSNRRAMGLGHTNVEPIARVLKSMDYCGFISAEVLPLPDVNAAAQATLKSWETWFS